MEKCGTLDISEEAIAILADRWWPQTAKENGDNMCKTFECNIWKKVNERPRIGGVFFGVGTVLRHERDVLSTIK